RREVHRHFAVQIVAVALEEGVLLDVNHDVEIARWPTARPRLALTAQTQPLTGRDAGGYPHTELLLLLKTSRAAAGRTRLRDDGARSPALPARPCDGEEPLLIPELSSA